MSSINVCQNKVYNSALLYGVAFGVSSTVVNWLGHSITHIGFLLSFCFGVVSGITIPLTQILVKKMGIQNDWANIGIRTCLSGAVAYGASTLAAAIGLVASPISIPGALLLTISSIALYVIT